MRYLPGHKEPSHEITVKLRRGKIVYSQRNDQADATLRGL